MLLAKRFRVRPVRRSRDHEPVPCPFAGWLIDDGRPTSCSMSSMFRSRVDDAGDCDQEQSNSDGSHPADRASTCLRVESRPDGERGREVRRSMTWVEHAALHEVGGPEHDRPPLRILSRVSRANGAKTDDLHEFSWGNRRHAGGIIKADPLRELLRAVAPRWWRGRSTFDETPSLIPLRPLPTPYRDPRG